jgi:hypothetical protein
MNLKGTGGVCILISRMRHHDAARRKSDGCPCQGPAMGNGRCRVHGGLSTGPRTPQRLERSRRANWKHGYYAVEARFARHEARKSIRLLRRLALGL